MPLTTLWAFPAQHQEQGYDRLDLRNINLILLMLFNIFQGAVTVGAAAQLCLFDLFDLFRFWLFAVLELTLPGCAPAFPRLLDTLRVPPCKRNRLSFACALQFFDFFAEFSQGFIRLG